MITKHISKSFIFIVAFVVFLGVAFNAYIYWVVSNESSDVRGLNKIYTVSNVVKNCIAETCKWEVTYNYRKIVKSVSINEPSIKVGDTVYERLICKKVSGSEKGKTYDPRTEPEENKCTRGIMPKYALLSVLENASKSCGGICSMEFQGVYNSNVPN